MSKSGRLMLFEKFLVKLLIGEGLWCQVQVLVLVRILVGIAKCLMRKGVGRQCGAF